MAIVLPGDLSRDDLQAVLEELSDDLVVEIENP